VAKLLIGSKKLGECNNGTDLLITMQSMVGIMGRALAVDEKVWFFSFCLFVCLSRFRITKFQNIQEGL